MGVVGIQEEGSPHRPSSPIPVVLHFIHEGNDEVGFDQRWPMPKASAASFALADPEARPESRGGSRTDGLISRRDESPASRPSPHAQTSSAAGSFGHAGGKAP